MEANMREKIRGGDTAFVANLGNKKRAGGGRKLDVIRVLVAEDHTVVRDGLVAIIKQEADMDVVAETGDGQQAAELWKQHRPDITLMDLRMPGMDGVNAIYQIRAAEPNAHDV
jgi:two-component system NarL family response regulator